ncbi:sensor histidine kinase [Enterococcus gallinarum]|uniref:sensor histidine kinase n=1 Tax=Enterococcus gallinarum TaxID=1353 RepID=UPI0028FD781D|nr:sensor histidine kinase [Enterococcus gallinarum]GMS51391.1 sensor histidine kinase [Enterococcus gallinarum]
MKKTSIKGIFQQTNKLMILVAFLPLLISSIFYSRQIFIYQNTINNIEEANQLSGKVDAIVLEEMWDLVFGQKSVADVQVNNVIEELRADLDHIQTNTNTAKEKNTLAVALRTLDSLETYQNKLIENIANDEPLEKNQYVMVQVDSMIELLSEILQEFVRVEISLASQTNQDLIQSVLLLIAFQLLLILLIIYFISKNRRFVRENLQNPLDRLVELSDELAQGHLGFRAVLPDTPELRTLTSSLNKMADDLTRLLEENALKQYHLAQSEVRVLQAQITPHFIYNSLDAIVSLIEVERYEQATEMTYALSDFFRISLSKGHDWIPLSKELRHVADYLTILKIRYGEMLTYEINQQTTSQDLLVLKMILQPLVENAVYHGTKFVRRVGKITITIQEYEQTIQMSVRDNGIGISHERLMAIQHNLKENTDRDPENGYGLYNVYRRLLLNYGSDVQFDIASIESQGTTISIIVPKKGGAH